MPKLPDQERHLEAFRFSCRCYWCDDRQEEDHLSCPLAKSTLFSNKSVKHKLLVDGTADYICQGLQSLSVVDEPAFRHLLEIAELRFRLPHHTYFTGTVIPSRAATEKQLAAVENCLAQYLISVPF